MRSRTVRHRARARRPASLALCAALLALAGVASPAGAVEVPNHLLLGAITGEKIGPFEQFKDACGVAVDSKATSTSPTTTRTGSSSSTKKRNT